MTDTETFIRFVLEKHRYVTSLMCEQAALLSDPAAAEVHSHIQPFCHPSSTSCCTEKQQDEHIKPVSVCRNSLRFTLSESELLSAGQRSDNFTQTL